MLLFWIIVFISGGLAETPLHGGLVGPTFACIIGIQFRNLRKCDRFWYENSNPLIRFTEAQLAEVRKMTLSKILCDNCDQVLTLCLSTFLPWISISKWDFLKGTHWFKGLLVESSVISVFFLVTKVAQSELARVGILISFSYLPSF